MLRRKLVALLGALAVVAACASPTLPLPPPEIPDQTISTTDPANKIHLESKSGSHPGATIEIINNAYRNDPMRFGVLTYADATGTWSAEVYAKTGDLLDISQRIGTNESASQQYKVR